MSFGVPRVTRNGLESSRRARPFQGPTARHLPVLVTDPAYWGKRAADGTFTFEEL